MESLKYFIENQKYLHQKKDFFLSVTYLVIVLINQRSTTHRYKCFVLEVLLLYKDF